MLKVLAALMLFSLCVWQGFAIQHEATSERFLLLSPLTDYDSVLQPKLKDACSKCENLMQHSADPLTFVRVQGTCWKSFNVTALPLDPKGRCV